MGGKVKVAFLCPYGFGVAPGQRFRVELFLNYIEEYIDAKCFYFLSDSTTKILYKKGQIFRKGIGVCLGYFRRLLSLNEIRTYDYIFIFREAAPLGPPVFEYILSKILKKRIIYDFDDAIWLSNTTSENSLISFLKCHDKVSRICDYSYKVSCGNRFLKAYADEYCKETRYIPTIVDTVNSHKPPIPKPTSKMPIVGWTGTHSTLKYLKPLERVLREIEQDYQFEFVVIADKDPMFELSNYRFVKWTQESEIADLSQLDIGLMPLVDSDWCKGKCGFKAIQYMSLGIATIASNVGVSDTIIDDGENGFLCLTEDDWRKSLSILLGDNELRQNIGREARKKIVDKFSLRSLLPDYYELFDIDVTTN